MKIKRSNACFDHGKRLLKNLMRTFIFLFCATVFSLTPNNIVSQNSKIIIEEDKSLTVDEVFNLIMSQTDYNFFYEEGIFKGFPNVSVKKGIIRTNKLLKQSLLNGDFEITITNDFDILIKKKEPDNVSVVQSVQVSGTVVDDNGTPLPGASVLEKNTTNGTTTDFDGKFTLSVSGSEAILVVSYLGYTTKEVPVENQTDLSIQLNESASQLDELVIIGYGSVTNRNVTGAVEQVNIDGIAEKPVVNAIQAIQGQVPGVTVINDGGDPTAAPIVKIRGQGTFSNEAPLYVVDGVPNAPIPSPNNIKSMSVLKDASSAAIYGLQAAGGVVIIETKKGKEGKMNVSFNSYIGFNEATNILTSLNTSQYAQVINTAMDNAGISSNDPRRDYINPNLNPDGFVDRTNWTNEIFRTGIQNHYDVAISGGSQKSNFYSSIGYRKTEGILLNTYQERIDFALNSSHQLTDKLKVTENFSAIYTDGNYGANTGDAYAGVIISSIYFPQSATVYQDEAQTVFGGTAPVDSPYIGNYGDLINPVASLLRLNDKRPTYTLNGNIKLNYEILPNFFYNFNGAVNVIKEDRKNFVPSRLEPGKPEPINSLLQSTTENFYVLAENTLTYEKSFGNHNIDLLVGYTYQKNNRKWFSASANGFVSESESSQFFPIATGPFQTPNSGETGNAIISQLGRAIYNYDGKYIVTGTIRRDGTSKLTKDNRWGVFPSISGAWRVSDEEFLQDSFLSELKLRAGWGEIGNVNALTDFPFNSVFSSINALMGANATPTTAYRQNELSNPNLKWETTSQTDIGLDFAFLNGKLKGTFDYFVKNTEGILLRKDVVGTAGVNLGQWENAADVENKGFEFSLGYTNYDNEFKYSVSANVSQAKNKVTSLQGRDFLTHDNNVRGVLRPLRSTVGQPLYSYYVNKSSGLFQSQAEIDAHVGADGSTLLQPNARPGDLRFENLDGDNDIDGDDRYFAGSALPEISYGFQFNFEYKRFDLSILFQGVSGVKVFNGLKFSTIQPTQGYNMLTDVLNAWTPNNTNTDIPLLSLDDPNGTFNTTSDWYLEDASYLRLKNINLGYNFPEKITNKLRVSDLRLYVAGSNLLTITDYTGIDPEVISNNGLDVGRYPSPRTLLFGLNLNI